MLNWLLWIKWLVLLAFSMCIFFASKFVTVLEIDGAYSLLLIAVFSLFLLFVPYSAIRRFGGRTESEDKKLRSAELVIKFQIPVYVLMLVIGAFFLPFRSEYAYRTQLIAKYNQIDENANYLDRLHRKFSCCGVMGQKFNITRDPTIWNPDDDVLRKLPNSCCSRLDENRCTYLNVHPTTCESAFQRAAQAYKTTVLILLGVSIVFTLISTFALNRTKTLQQNQEF